jgi:hypothetical protein
LTYNPARAPVRTRHEVWVGATGVVVDVTVVVVWYSPVVVEARVVVAGTTMVLETTTVTMEVEVEATALLSVTVTTGVSPGTVTVVITSVLTALTQEQANEYSSGLAQFEAMGYRTDEDAVIDGEDSDEDTIVEDGRPQPRFL